MRVVYLVLASFFFFCSSVMADESQWHLLGAGRQASFEILKSSVTTDKSTMSRQFVLRTTLKTPLGGKDGKKVHYYVENVLTLCKQNIFVTMLQMQYDHKDELVNVNTSADVYENLQVTGDPISHIMEWACGRKTIDVKKKELVGT